MEIDETVVKLISQYRLQSLGSAGLLWIIEKLQIKPFYAHLASKNPGNLLPYHNFYHAGNMLLNCYEGAVQTGLPLNETRGVCVAALLHDFNHSGGHLPDAENIINAKNGLIGAQAIATIDSMELSEYEFEIAYMAIETTQYPYQGNLAHATGAIIRDADLMHPYDENKKAMIEHYLGLKKEIEIQHGHPYTVKEFADGMKDFLDTITWHSNWGARKANVRNWALAKSYLFDNLSNQL